MSELSVVLAEKKVNPENSENTERPKRKRQRSRRISVLPEKRKAFDDGAEQAANRQAWNCFKLQLRHYAATSASIPQAQFLASKRWREVTDCIELSLEHLAIFRRNKDSLSIGGGE